MTTYTKHAVGRCPNCGFGIAAMGATSISCPNCGERVRLRFVAVLAWNGNQLCDDRCMYATSNTCSCRCDGENHGAGYLGIDTVPQWVRERDAKAAEQRKRRAEERKAREAKKAADARDEILAAHPLLRELANDEIAFKSDFLLDMRRVLETGRMTERQIAAAEKVITEIRRREEERAARERRQAELRAAGVTVPTGRRTFTGTVIAVRSEPSRFRNGDEHRMLVEAAEGWRAWGTVPRSLRTAVETPRELIGRKVEVTATIERRTEDSLFGIMRRPIAQLMG
jgi:predicted RNA-binding Zn-ribbon protein involved in translation (DUF1610 family)